MKTLGILVLGLLLGFGVGLATVKYCPEVRNVVLTPAVKAACDCSHCHCDPCTCTNCTCKNCPGKAPPAKKGCCEEHK